MMNLPEIQALLNDPDSSRRQKAILALKDYDADTAIPLLISKREDPQFLVRSFVAMGLGRKQSEDAFGVLLEMMAADQDPNVQAEAANSLAMYGKPAVNHLVRAFYHTDHWLVRRSILAAMLDLNAPAELLNICLEAIKDEDMTVVQAALDILSTLVGTEQEDAALETVLSFVTDEHWRTRMQVAYSLRRFNRESARQGLIDLRQDEHHKVVAAALEGLLPD